MGLLAWTMMGLALWHFTIWLPDHFWGGIAGAFVGSIVGSIVIGLAIPVAIVGEHANRGLAGGIGGALALCALLLGGVVGRPGMGWAVWAGTVLQALVIAAGVVVPAMYVLGVIFAALWVTGIWLARRLQTPPAPTT